MLKRLKNDKVVSAFTPVEFPVPNVEELANELDVESKAKRHARKDAPDTSSKVPDVNEDEIKIYFKTTVAQAGTKVQESAGILKGEIFSINLNQQYVEISNYVEVFSNKAQTLLGSVKAEMKELTDIYDKSVEDLEMFKTKNKIKREAFYPQSNILSIGMLLLFVLIESVFNGYFFAGGNDLGLLGGLIQAVVISIVNISLGVMIGLFLIPQMHHIDRVHFYLGLLGLIFTVVLGVIFNILVAHYRTALVHSPDNANEVAVQSFTNNMFYISEVDSWILFALGFIFFLAAAWKAYKFDDPYPGYGKLDRTKELAKAEILESYDHSIHDLEELYDESCLEIKELSSKAQRNLNKLNGYYTTLAHQNTILERYVELLSSAYAALIKRYRHENIQHRSTPPPTFFDDEVDDHLPCSFPIESVNDTRQENEKILSEITKELPNVTLRLDGEYRKLINEFSEFKQL